MGGCIRAPLEPTRCVSRTKPAARYIHVHVFHPLQIHSTCCWCSYYRWRAHGSMPWMPRCRVSTAPLCQTPQSLQGRRPQCPAPWRAALRGRMWQK